MMQEKRPLRENQSDDLKESPLEERSLCSKEKWNETAYLLSNSANRKHLVDSIEQLKSEESLVIFTAEEWGERYSSQT